MSVHARKAGGGQVRIRQPELLDQDRSGHVRGERAVEARRRAPGKVLEDRHQSPTAGIGHDIGGHTVASGWLEDGRHHVIGRLERPQPRGDDAKDAHDAVGELRPASGPFRPDRDLVLPEREGRERRAHRLERLTLDHHAVHPEGGRIDGVPHRVPVGQRVAERPEQHHRLLTGEVLRSHDGVHEEREADRKLEHAGSGLQAISERRG